MSENDSYLGIAPLGYGEESWRVVRLNHHEQRVEDVNNFKHVGVDK